MTSTNTNTNTFNVNTKQKTVFRGDIYYADLGIVAGSEQGGIRPVIIVQNNVGNKYSPTVQAVPVTKAVHTKSNIPTHVMLTTDETGLREDSIALAEQSKVIDKCRLKQKVGNINVNSNLMRQINEAIMINFGLIPVPSRQENKSVYAFAQ